MHNCWNYFHLACCKSLLMTFWQAGKGDESCDEGRMELFALSLSCVDAWGHSLSLALSLCTWIKSHTHPMYKYILSGGRHHTTAWISYHFPPPPAPPTLNFFNARYKISADLWGSPWFTGSMQSLKTLCNFYLCKLKAYKYISYIGKRRSSFLGFAKDTSAHKHHATPPHTNRNSGPLQPLLHYPPQSHLFCPHAAAESQCWPLQW